MLSRAFAGVALCFALLFSAPAFAQACYPYDATLAQLMASDEVTSGEMAIVEVAPEDLEGFIVGLNEVTGLDLKDVTRAFVFIGPKVLVGVEIAGCLLDPIEVVMPLNSSMSGKLPDGRVAA